MYSSVRCFVIVQGREEMISIDSLSCGATQAVEEVVMEGKNSLF